MKVLLWDVDGTLLDFEAAERNAMKACFLELGLGICTDEMIRDYSMINKRYWQRMERGEITKQEVLVGRFQEFFALAKVDVSKAKAFNALYQISLGDTIVFHDNSFEIIKDLKKKGYKQYVVTNGTKAAQDKKLEQSGLMDLFDGIFISEEIGHEKPMKGFFDVVFKKIVQVPKQEIMIIGDSQTSDMRGGMQAGITCCWYNPHKETRIEGIRVEHEITDLHEVYQIIGEQIP